MKCCDIIAADLRQAIALERNTKTANGSGGFVYLWAPYATIKAGVKNLSGNERWVSERVDAVAKVRFTLRYREDILEADRIIFEGKAHNITFIDNVEYRKRWLIIDCEKGVPVKANG